MREMIRIVCTGGCGRSQEMTPEEILRSRRAPGDEELERALRDFLTAPDHDYQPAINNCCGICYRAGMGYPGPETHRKAIAGQIRDLFARLRAENAELKARAEGTAPFARVVWYCSECLAVRQEEP